MPTLRDYQIDISKQAFDILKKYKLVYLMMSVRTGKTLTALETAKLYGAKKVLFLTKKKAIESILQDYKEFGYNFNLDVLNDESLHKIESNNYDLVIHDEHSRFGSFPKPSETTKDYKRLFGTLPMIFLSGTPNVESGSMLFHQFWVSYNSPFKQYVNFYNWSKDFVNVKKKRVGGFEVNDYSESKDDKIMAIIDKYCIKFTQEDAGFSSKVNQNILYIDRSEKLYNLVSKLKKDKVIEGKNEVILADTGAKMMQKIHQIENGTIKFESGNSMTLDKSKALFIKDHFKGQKIAIFYYFVEEFNLLKEVFENYTTDLEEFNTTDKIYIGQQYTNAMGVNLSKAESLVFYNFGFSGTQFIQSIDRLTVKDRLENDVYFVFQKGSLSEKIYNVVKDKMNYSELMFKKDLLTLC